MSKDKNKPDKWETPDWSDCKSLAEWFNRCRFMLQVHDLLTDSESARVFRRIERKVENIGTKGTDDETLQT